MENPPEIGPVRKWKGSASSHYYAGIYYSQVLREVADDLYQIESAADPAEGYREMKQGLPRIAASLIYE